jgi:hypothetical protein
MLELSAAAAGVAQGRTAVCCQGREREHCRAVTASFCHLSVWAVRLEWRTGHTQHMRGVLAGLDAAVYVRGCGWCVFLDP